MKKFLVSLVALTAVVTLAACGGQKDTSTSAAKSSDSSAAVAKDIEVQDSNGKVTVPYQPKKVVVFDNSALDTIDALGAGDSVVAAATDNMPDYLKQYKDLESAGGLKEPDLEKINQLQPDLIIISGRQRDFQKDLEAIAPTIFLNTDTKDTWASIQQNITTLGQIFGKEDKAKEEIKTLQADIDDLKAKATATDEKALVVLVNEGSVSAFGPGSRFSVVYDTFGFTPVDDQLEASTHGQSVSYEYILEKNPDILYVVDRTKAIGGDTSENNLMDNDLVKQTNAGKNNKVISLNPQVWYLAGSGVESLKIMMDDVSQGLE